MARVKTPQPCLRCGTMFHRHNGNTDAKYCGRSCRTFSVNEVMGNPSTRPGVAEKIGDALRDRGEGKTYRKRGGRHEHRTVAEQKLGRALRSGEIVHHEDDNKRNNDPANLVIFASQAEHARHHKERNASI